MYRTIFLLSSALLMATTPTWVGAQSFDTSGTASLKGQYLFRYVNFFPDQMGNLVESCTLTGAITFDGAGKYTLLNTKLYDSAGSNGAGFCASLGGGTYGVQSNGLAQLDNPLYQATLFGTFSKPVVTASSTEDGLFDLFIAVQAPASASNGILAGPFTVGTLDFLNADASLARQGYFTLNADGHGNFAAFSVTGSLQNVRSGATVTQDVAASTYAFSSGPGGTMTFPGDGNSKTAIIGGEKVLYVSADGNWFIAGSATGSDMIFGFRAPSGTSSNKLLSGTYLTAGIENTLPGTLNVMDAFYGSTVTNGAGDLIAHERYDPVLGFTNDFTISTAVSIGADGSYYDGNTYTYLAGANGKALMQIGSNQQFSLIIGVQAPSYKATSAVWIDPIGITEAANYTGITNAVSPGELVSLYGTFGVQSQSAKTLPISTNLGGVQVFVNGIAAPVYLVSENQISVLIPYEIAGDSFATFQVEVNGTKSNLVTLYSDNTSPGIYTQTANGIGAGAILHTDYSEVTAANPAMPGDTVIMFMSGLGPVTPGVGDGASASGSPISNSVESPYISVYLFDGSNFVPAQVLFAGLAPFYAGLYQVNFTLPSGGLNDGNASISFGTLEAINQMATISLSGFSSTTALNAPRRAPMLRRPPVPAGAAGRHPKGFRRALP